MSSFPALEARWAAQREGAKSGARYELQEPLLALQRTLAAALTLPWEEASALLAAAGAARRAGRLMHATVALHELAASLRSIP